MHGACSDTRQDRTAEGDFELNAPDSGVSPQARKRVERKASTLRLSDEVRQRLLEQLTHPATSPRYARRVRVILLSNEGVKGVEIAERLQLSVGQVSRIRKSFLELGVSSLADKPHPGRRDHAVSEEAIALITRIAASPPPAGHKRWSTRLIAAKVGFTSATIAKVLRRVNGVTPVRLKVVALGRRSNG